MMGEDKLIPPELGHVSRLHMVKLSLDSSAAMG